MMLDVLDVKCNRSMVVCTRQIVEENNLAKYLLENNESFVMDHHEYVVVRV